jgi:predicted HicB family RNase H-like nuclease
MTYLGYESVVEFDEDAMLFHGEVINTRDVITFQGTSVAELTQAFHDSVDDYIEFCKELGREPEKPFSGNFMLRVSPELHRRLSSAAAKSGKSLNSFVAEKLESELRLAS